MSKNNFKRPATSPIFKMAKKNQTQLTPLPAEPKNDSVILIDIVELNGKEYFGDISDDDVLYIWLEVFKRKIDELVGTKTFRNINRQTRISFKLNKPTTPAQFYPTSTFTFEKNLDCIDIFKGVIIGHGNQRRLELGVRGIIKVTTFFKVEAPHVIAWLCHFGQVSAEYRIVKNSCNINTDVTEFEVVLHTHVPEYLPIYGHKIAVFYPGMPRVCNNCYKTGHVRKLCKSPKALWIDYVEYLLKSGEFEVEIFGNWVDIIASRTATNE